MVAMGTYRGEQLENLVGGVTAAVKAPYSGGSEIHHGLLMKHTGKSFWKWKTQRDL